MHVEDLYRAINTRLGKLELRAAQYGINTPPEVSIEAENLGKVKRALNTLMQQAETQGAVSADLYNRVINTLDDTQVTVSSIEFGKREDRNRL